MENFHYRKVAVAPTIWNVGSKCNNAASNKRELFNIEAEIRKQEFNEK
jgi:hypothetical protein